MKTQNRSIRYKEMIGILGIAIVLYSISNFSTPLLTKILSLDEPSATINFINRLLLWGGLLLLFFYTRHIEKQPLLLWKEKRRSVLAIVLSVVVVLIIIFVGFVAIVLLLQYLDGFPSSSTNDKTDTVFNKNMAVLVFTAFTAGVLEEIVFRGYMQPRLERATGSQLWGIVLNSLLFALMHFSYGTLLQVVIPFFIGIVFSIYYARYRSLLIIIICHFTWDLVTMIDAL